MLAQRGHFVIAGRDRIAASRLAAKQGADLVILDDGMQYLRLARAIEIVLVPAEGLGNGFVLPAGPLREPPDALARADLLVRTGEDPLAPIPPVSCPVVRFSTQPEALCTLQGKRLAPDTPLLAVAGIARPERFFTALERIGHRIAQRIAFEDHHRYTPKEVRQLVSQRLPVATTEKDAVKLAPLWPEDAPPLAVLRLRAVASSALIEAIDALIAARIAPAIRKGGLR